MRDFSLKKGIASVGAVLGVSAVGLPIYAARQEPLLAQGSIVGVVPVGGLTREEGARRIRLWWESERAGTVNLKCSQFKKDFGNVRWDALGVAIDDVASISQVPLEGFGETLQRNVGLKRGNDRFELVFKFDPLRSEPYRKFISEVTPKGQQARVTLVKGAITRQYEGGGVGFDQAAWEAAVRETFMTRATQMEVPVTKVAKNVPDEELNRIINTMASFSTRFPASNRPRCANIENAAKIIDGYVLMPGEQVSFNGAVGQRTIARGFREAGVYRQGRHDVGVGGGICQVSTTLYNAALMANLKIVKRSNHSLPVAYVPTGRDATVSWGNPDLVLENPYDFPIAFDSAYAPGQLTFSVLGIKDPSLKIEIVRGKVSVRGRGTTYQHDPSLPYGKVKLIDAGGDRITVPTWRVIYKDGKVIERESLGTSVYAGAPRLYAKNMKAKAPVAAPPTTEGASGSGDVSPNPSELPADPDQ